MAAESLLSSGHLIASSPVSSRSEKRLFVNFQTMSRMTISPAMLPVTARPITVPFEIDFGSELAAEVVAAGTAVGARVMTT